MQKKLQVLADPVDVNFFRNALDPTLVILFGNENGIKAPIKSHTSFPNKITSFGSSAFRKNIQRLDQPTLVRK